MIILNFIIFFGALALFYFLRKREIQLLGKPVSIVYVLKRDPSLATSDLARFLGKQIGLWICIIYISDWIFRTNFFSARYLD